jgi:lipoprotein-anchoring transpeptidase ErfK/SrfK
MRILTMLAAAFVAALIGAPALAAVNIQVDLSRQTMHVANQGEIYNWPISSARAGYVTPRGIYHPTSLQVMHYSHKYQMSPMPHSIFFKGGYAIHGTYETGSLGRPASHGCIRLSPAHASLLFGMVQAQGARIVISGTPPRSASVLSRFRTPRRSTRIFYQAEPYAAPEYPVYSWGEPGPAW